MTAPPLFPGEQMGGRIAQIGVFFLEVGAPAETTADAVLRSGAGIDIQKTEGARFKAWPARTPAVVFRRAMDADFFG